MKNIATHLKFYQQFSIIIRHIRLKEYGWIILHFKVTESVKCKIRILKVEYIFYLLQDWGKPCTVCHQSTEHLKQNMDLPSWHFPKLYSIPWKTKVCKFFLRIWSRNQYIDVDPWIYEPPIRKINRHVQILYI